MPSCAEGFFLKGAVIIKQKGQASVEFAFIVTLFIFITFGMIYGGMLFMDYLQYNNGARAIARAVAFEQATSFNNIAKKKLQDEYIHPITNLYTAKTDNIEIKKKITENKVTVSITLTLTQPMGLTDFIGFPPETLKPIVYTMPIETAAQ